MLKDFSPRKTESGSYWENTAYWRSKSEKNYCNKLWRKMRVKILEPYVGANVPILHRYPDGFTLRISPKQVMKREYRVRTDHFVWGKLNGKIVPMPYLEGKDLELYQLLGKEAWLYWKLSNGKKLKDLTVTKSPTKEILNEWHTQYQEGDGKHLLMCLLIILKATKKDKDYELDWEL